MLIIYNKNMQSEDKLMCLYNINIKILNIESNIKEMKQICTLYLLITLLYQTSAAITNQLKDIQSDITEVIQIAKGNLWKAKQSDKPLWKFTTQFGPMFLSQYHFFLKALNMNDELANFKSKFQVEKLREQLISSQLPDGSWYQVTDLNRKQGSLDATIINYWFLKDIGVPQSSETLKKARKFVLEKGGIEDSELSTKLTLAIFGQYQWHLVPYVPFIAFHNQNILSYFYIKDAVSQWAYPLLISLTYLRYFKTIFPVSRVCLSELRISRSNHCQETIKKIKSGQLFVTKNATEQNESGWNIVQKIIDIWINKSIQNILEEMINLRGNKGSFAGNTKSTILNLCILKHYGMQFGNNTDFYAYYLANIQQSLNFVENLYFNQKNSHTVIQDTTYLDTLQTINSLLQAGENPMKLHDMILYIIKNKVNINGGIPVGVDLSPNIDASSYLLAIQAKMRQHFLSVGDHQSYQFYDKQINRTATWILQHQNQDGGFAALEKGKTAQEHFIMKFLFWLNGLDKSFQIFDSSCVDITGHVLQSLGLSSLYEKQDVLQKIISAIQYIEKNQKSQLWVGRWGINYLYAASAVLPSLKKIGFNLEENWVRKAVDKIKSLQHEDGSFGQSSTSYIEGKFVDGIGTVSMTAWALIALIEVQDIANVDTNIYRATQYLIFNFRMNQNRFIDKSVVGTWKRKFLYSQPKSHAQTYPLLALSRVKKLIKNSRQNLISKYSNVVASAYNKTKTDNKDL